MRESDFEARYQQDSDPFGVGTRWYERRKQQILLASLGKERYGLAWDVACGTGHLALALSRRCARVLATDAAPSAVGLTRKLTRGCPQVCCEVSALPALPSAARGADLTVVAEVLYYLPDDLRGETMDLLAEQTGEVAAVHWRHHPDDAYLGGAEVTDVLEATLTSAGWARTARHEDTDFLLGSWVRNGSR